MSFSRVADQMPDPLGVSVTIYAQTICENLVPRTHLPATLSWTVERDAHLMADSLAREDGPQREGEACDEGPVAPLPGLWARQRPPLHHAAVVIWLLPRHPLRGLLQLRGRPEQHQTLWRPHWLCGCLCFPVVPHGWGVIVRN